MSIERVFPSIAVQQFNTAHHTPIGDEEIGADIINQMDLSFSSPLLRSTERRFFGERTLKSGLNLEEFDVFARTGKAEVDLSGVFGLGTIAAARLYEFYEKNGSLPASGKLKVKVDMAPALPIGEYIHHSKIYLQKYLNEGQPHIVTFHNFERSVHVEILFEHAYVAKEGESAQYELMFAKGAFLDMIHREAVKRFHNGGLNGITGKGLVTTKNMLGSDIGEGTIDFVAFSNGLFNADAFLIVVSVFSFDLLRGNYESQGANSQVEGATYILRKKARRVQIQVFSRSMRVEG
ncbi:hypothetical protein MM221_13055 [Salipaludibacillus sp. LMS25]|jgi:plasmid segregation protein ParM|uniref:hypothetical protein n=1 Tax=Salipaludibacillus sp. LMS25 TaxID=2924031 RepID=UPI0020D133CF|nr:hypothetical protein [Salipaludibacillus sp. LMS25]UTR13551.1 hypothetical protein MM221_13055 [Salipaludibacillus sp. LMS25]